MSAPKPAPAFPARELQCAHCKVVVEVPPGTLTLQCPGSTIAAEQEEKRAGRAHSIGKHLLAHVMKVHVDDVPDESAKQLAGRFAQGHHIVTDDMGHVIVLEE